MIGEEGLAVVHLAGDQGVETGDGIDVFYGGVGAVGEDGAGVQEGSPGIGALLGAALAEINSYFYDLYGPLSPSHFYGMDVEFKFDDDWEGNGSELWIKQARPYPGWGMNGS